MYSVYECTGRARLGRAVPGRGWRLVSCISTAAMSIPAISAIPTKMPHNQPKCCWRLHKMKLIRKPGDQQKMDKPAVKVKPKLSRSDVSDSSSIRYMAPTQLRRMTWA